MILGDAMRKKVREIMSKECMLYVIIAVGAAILFCAIYDVRVLNPTYVDWLLNGGDLAQHYLGWVGYRAGDWCFPIGMTDRLAYPYKSSVIFTDSIPCFAVLIKILSPFLPARFQYFGLWGITCFILQGVLSARIIRNYVDSKAYVFGVSILFTLVPTVFQRMFGHTALAGQWVILLALEPLFAHRRYSLKKNRKIFATWMTIACVSASIHIYFILMCGIILCGYCFLDIIVRKKVLKNILLIAAYLLAAAAVVGLLGGYSSAGSVASVDGLGVHSMNLNAFINPSGYSNILQDRNSFPGQYEGFAYLGAGALFLSVFSVIVALGHSDAKKNLLIHLKQLLAIGIVSVISVVIAVSPIITWGDKVLTTLEVPAFVTDIWSIFRSSGRISWIVLYIIVISSCIVTYKFLNRRTAVMALIFCLMFQAYDLRGQLRQIHFNFSREIVYESPLQNTAFWENIGNNNAIEHIVFTDSISPYESYVFAEWALHYDKTLSFFAFSHANTNMFEEIVQDSLERLPETDLYIFPAESQFEYYKYDLYYYSSDGYIIGYCVPLDVSE